MSRFYIASSSPSPTASPTYNASDNSDSDSDNDLPYPVPLPRSAFLSPTFTPQSYLSTLHNRHQTLEDLRSELRARSSLLSRELLDLVNANYQDFLGLGTSLKGGDERVEEVRVGLLGFKKEVEGLRNGVKEREEEVNRLVEEREETREKIAVGRALIEYEARLRVLEEGLVIEKHDGESSDSEEEDDDEDGEDEDGALGGVSLAKLKRHVLQYRVVQDAEKSLGGHPFIAAQVPRMIKVRNTLLLDLSTALQQAKKASEWERVMKIMKIYADMDEAGEAVKVLKGFET
ncbi:hypothetical protein N0V90_008584 [Kalmusia sp. IMI 367209]|nr:hypothetical protein N0V90_008584 [Kalmusia sp. IMI 367209]